MLISYWLAPHALKMRWPVEKYETLSVVLCCLNLTLLTNFKKSSSLFNKSICFSSNVFSGQVTKPFHLGGKLKSAPQISSLGTFKVGILLKKCFHLSQQKYKFRNCTISKYEYLGMWSVRVSQANPGGRLPRFRYDRLLPPRAETKTTENSSLNKIAKYSGDSRSLPLGPFFSGAEVVRATLWSGISFN